MLACTYGLAALVDVFLFDFGFLRDAPFYRPGRDHHGYFTAWQPVTALVGSVAGMLILLLFDFWPLERLGQYWPALNRQPLRGLVLSACVGLLVALAWVGIIGWAQWALVTFMTRVCVAMIFGIFVILILFKNLPLLQWAQPLRGLALCTSAALLAVALYGIYYYAGSIRFALEAGSPGYTLELWISSAMLAITFPLMVAFAEYFAFWPISTSD